MSNKPNTKRAPEVATMSKSELHKKIAAARLELNTALMTGEPTAPARAALRTLEAELAAVEQREAAQAAEQAAQNQIESERIAAAAKEIVAARDARIAAISARFLIPDARTSFHA